MLKVIAFDLSSGESGIKIALNAAIDFLNKNVDWKVKAFSSENINNINHPRLEIVKVDGVVGPNDGVLEVRRNPNTTLVQSIKSVIDGKTSGVVSAAPSGPLVAISYLMSKTIRGVKPSFTAQLTGIDSRPRIILDVGANLDVDASTLNQYSIMGTEFTKALKISKSPNVHLLNIGTEVKKGLSLQKKAYELLSKNKKINFKGNIEPNNVFSQKDVDVVITDAYSGNIMLKSYEGATFLFKDIIKSSINKSILDKLGFIFTKNFRKKMKIYSNSGAGGAVILGLNHLVMKVHGKAEQSWLYNSLLQMKDLIEEDLIKNIKESKL